MCKCCQSCCETIYWHCIEKKFCYDENIALYEDTKSTHEDKTVGGYDNMAFYDKVALIAGRSIFTIEPLPEKKPIVHQPKKKLRWFEDEILQNQTNESKNLHVDRTTANLETVPEETDSVDSIEAISAETDDVDGKIRDVDDIKERESKELTPPCAVESKVIDESVTLRKKSLPQRRMSKGLVLKIDNMELPLIRQSAMPKFYLDTPEDNQGESCIANTPSVALTSPIRPQSHGFNYDLKSIVQIENERSQNVLDVKDSNRLSQIRSKLIPLKIKRTNSIRSTGGMTPRV